MNEIWEDYYKILQVNFNAEPEIITGAYRLLSKKYHPDVNRNIVAEEQMKRINVAYGILSDARKRTVYNIEWIRRTRVLSGSPCGGSPGGGSYGSGSSANASAGGRPSAGASSGRPASGGASAGSRHTRPVNSGGDDQIDKAREKIEKYYHYIKEGDFKAAYGCISQYDKNRIKQADFIRWRDAVAKSYELRSCAADFYKTHMHMRAEKTIFDKSFEFTLSLCERDIGNNRIKEYKSTKIAVFEGNGFGVFLGYANIKTIIAEYGRRDADTVDAKAMFECWCAEQARRDRLTGIKNLHGFLLDAKAEVSRFSRRHNIFSVVVFDLIGPSDVPGDAAITAAGHFFSDALRDNDIICRWKDGKFIALLAETNAAEAKQAVNRVCGEFNNFFLLRNTPGNYHALYAGTSEYDLKSIESTIRKCSANLAVAKLGGRRTVAGVFTRLRAVRFAVKPPNNNKSCIS